MKLLGDKMGGTHGLMQKLRSNLTEGLTGDDFKQREKVFGTCQEPLASTPTFITLLLEDLGDSMMKVLLAALVVFSVIPFMLG